MNLEGFLENLWRLAWRVLPENRGRDRLIVSRTPHWNYCTTEGSLARWKR